VPPLQNTLSLHNVLYYAHQPLVNSQTNFDLFTPIDQLPLTANVTLLSMHEWLLLFCQTLPAAACEGGREVERTPPPPS